MAVLQISGYKYLWFLHTQLLPIATEIAWKYGWQHFNQCIAQHTLLSTFTASGRPSGDAGTVLYLLCELLNNFSHQLRNIYLKSNSYNRLSVLQRQPQ
jgi:CRISPR-associated protein Cst1